LENRRRHLAERLNGRSIIIPSGSGAARNFPANQYAYRASSHFLYLVGEPISDSYLTFDGKAWTLSVPPPSDDDALWHGPAESCTALEHRLGLPVMTHDESTWDTASLVLPSMHSGTNDKLASVLGRPIHAGVVDPVDVELARAMVKQRSVHDGLAVEELKAAAEATAAAHHAAQAIIEPGLSCHEVWAAMQYEFTRRGMKAAYQPIITPHGEILHAHSLDEVLQDGDLVLIDVGAETASGWAGDVTRTWPVSGTLSPTQKDIMDVVYAAQQSAIDVIRPGVDYQEVHFTACRALAGGLVDLGILTGEPEGLVEQDVHALFMPHGTGHLIGLDVHDMEDLGALPGYPDGRMPSPRFGLCYLRLSRSLDAGMAVTVEPGFYQVPHLLRGSQLSQRVHQSVNWDRLEMFRDVRGIRIEDDVLVTPSGPSILSSECPSAEPKK